MTIHLRAIAEDDRRPEDELLADFERPGQASSARCWTRSRARSATSTRSSSIGCRAWPTSAKWVTAAEPGLGWEPGRVLRRLWREPPRRVEGGQFEADGVAVAIRDMVMADHPDGWEGTAAQLLAAINARVPDGLRIPRS